MPPKADKENREESIAFRCPGNWKRRITAAAALRGIDMRVAAIEALSRYFKVEIPRDRDQNAA